MAGLARPFGCGEPGHADQIGHRRDGLRQFILVRRRHAEPRLSEGCRGRRQAAVHFFEEAL